MRVLVTGVAGYIGSTFSYSCLKKGIEVIGIDNFANSSQKNIETIEKKFPDNFRFIELDLAADFNIVEDKLKNIYSDVVVHFAGLKAVGESQKKPIEYWENNLISTFNLVKVMKKSNMKKLIFSSSATVYGDSIKQPLDEKDQIYPMSCYGSTKIANEFFLRDVSNGHDLDVIALRYFNPVGSHKEKLIFEEIDQSPNNLMPRILRVAKGLDSKLLIYGDDYDTKDGTGERDYIHIEDLVDAHLYSIEKIKSFDNYNFFNIGTGSKHSVLELVKTFESVNKIKVPYEIVARRSGDVAICYADPTKAQKLLEWSAKKNLSSMCKSAWEAIKDNDKR